MKNMFSVQLFFKALRNVFVIISFSFFVFMIWMLAAPQSISAIGLFTDFAGKITTTVPCTNGILITVVGQKPGVFLYQYFLSRIHPAFQLLPTANVIGRASSFGVSAPCMLVPPAVNIPSEGTIINVATSPVI